MTRGEGRGWSDLCNSILRLTTGQLFGQPVLRDDAVFLEQPLNGGGYGYGGKRSHRVTVPSEHSCYTSRPPDTVR